MKKIEVALTDGTWLEGEPAAEPPKDALIEKGVWLNDVFRGKQEGQVPIGISVFVPYSNILFIVLDK
jgi:hypothetical protein